MTNAYPEIGPQELNALEPSIPDFELLMTDPVKYHLKNQGDYGNWFTRLIDEIIRGIS